MAKRCGGSSPELFPVANPYILHQLVRIYILAGQPERAIDGLEQLLKIPYYVSPAWLKIDPNFDPLRNNPRFRSSSRRSDADGAT